ncbi:MAG: amidohydrolase family protein [Verrucomicrobiae bacterium]
MIELPIIDAHIHIWDLTKLVYPWLPNVPCINRNFLLSDYDAASASHEIEAMVFVQSDCKPEQHRAELAWVQGCADADPRLKGIVPWAPLESGVAVRDELFEIAKDPRVKGVRRIIQFEEDVDFCVRPGFIQGVQLLGEVGLHCELTIAPVHFPNVMRLVENSSGTRFILDHIGNPDIKAGEIEPWKTHLKDFAASGPHFCKFSNLVCNADLEHWTLDDLRPFAEAVFEAFGPDRVIWGSDWPHALRATEFTRWLETADLLTAGFTDAERKNIFHDNAALFYRL